MQLPTLKTKLSRKHQSNEDCVKAQTSRLVMIDRRHVTPSTGDLVGKLIIADCGMYECHKCGRVQWIFKPETALVIHE